MENDARPFTCPHCGAEVPPGAAACPECGSDSQTGWSEKAAYDDLLLRDDEAPADSPKPAQWPTYLIAVVAFLTLSVYLVYALPWGIYLVPLVLVSIGLVYYVTRVLLSRRDSREQQMYHRLLQKARGDKELVERLVEHERRRNPSANRLTWMQDVLYYWERDSR